MAACLFLHGITSSPGQLQPQIEVLQAAGVKVCAPLLPGHGPGLKIQGTAPWEECLRAALTAAEQLREENGGEAIDLVGISYGALLGLRLVQTEPALVRRIVCVGTPIFLFRWMTMLYPLLRYTPLGRWRPSWPKDFSQAVADPAGREIYKSVSSDNFPLGAVEQIVRLQRVVAWRDRTAPPRGASYLVSHAGGPSRLVWLCRSLHVATLDYDREVINSYIREFLLGA